MDKLRPNHWAEDGPIIDPAICVLAVLAAAAYALLFFLA